MDVHTTARDFYRHQSLNRKIILWQSCNPSSKVWKCAHSLHRALSKHLPLGSYFSFLFLMAATRLPRTPRKHSTSVILSKHVTSAVFAQVAASSGSSCYCFHFLPIIISMLPSGVDLELIILLASECHVAHSLWKDRTWTTFEFTLLSYSPPAVVELHTLKYTAVRFAEKCRILVWGDRRVELSCKRPWNLCFVTVGNGSMGWRIFFFLFSKIRDDEY